MEAMSWPRRSRRVARSAADAAHSPGGGSSASASGGNGALVIPAPIRIASFSALQGRAQGVVQLASDRGRDSSGARSLWQAVVHKQNQRSENAARGCSSRLHADPCRPLVQRTPSCLTQTAVYSCQSPACAVLGTKYASSVDTSEHAHALNMCKPTSPAPPCHAHAGRCWGQLTGNTVAHVEGAHCRSPRPPRMLECGC